MDSGGPGQSIAIEITEGLLMDVSTDVTSELRRFREAGIEVSMDGFGTGYSSPNYLKKFDIDYLKPDIKNSTSPVVHKERLIHRENPSLMQLLHEPERARASPVFL